MSLMALYDEGRWHRLPAIALLVLIVHITLRLVRQNTALLAGAGASFVVFAGLPGLLLIVALLISATTLSALVYQRRFRFRLDEDAICVRKGVFKKQELRIRFARIQNVQIAEPFYLRPFGLVLFSLETPGAVEKEVELPGISRCRCATASCMARKTSRAQLITIMRPCIRQAPGDFSCMDWLVLSWGDWPVSSL
jgi:putative membrane protein